MIKTNIGDITYKKATKEEIDALIELRIKQLTDEYTASGRIPPKDVDIETALRDYYEEHMEDGTFVSWLAYDGDRIVGTSGMSFVDKPPYFTNLSGGIGLLSSMYTDPDYRRMGIARELLDHVVGEAKDHGCGTIHITASDMGAKLYKAYGFKHNDNFFQLVIE